MTFSDLAAIRLFRAPEDTSGASQVVLMIKNRLANAGKIRDVGLIPGSGRSPGRGHGNALFLPGESHEQRSLAGYGA